MFKILAVVLTLLFYSFAISIVEYDNDNENLIAVALTYRHGERSPIVSFPTDEYFNITYWPMGFGQLTKFGIASHYELGQWFRQRYKNFLSEIYSANEIYIYSTDTDRTLMSAYANLAGLYPPKDYQKWNDQIPWQPIPVHTDDRVKDDIIVEKRICKKYDILYKNVKKRTEEEFNKKYDKFLRYIEAHSGWPNVTIQEAKTLRSVLNTYRSYNRSFIPEWTKSIDQSTLDYLSAVVYKLPTYTPILARLQTGPFFAHLFNYFDSFVQPSMNDNIRPKFLMISSHDTATTSILNAMGAYYKMKPVNFTDTVIWELRKKDTNSYFINLLYKSRGKLESLNIYSCDFNCDYTDFKNSMVNITTTVADWLKECNV